MVSSMPAHLDIAISLHFSLQNCLSCVKVVWISCVNSPFQIKLDILYWIKFLALTQSFTMLSLNHFQVSVLLENKPSPKFQLSESGLPYILPHSFKSAIQSSRFFYFFKYKAVENIMPLLSEHNRFASCFACLTLWRHLKVFFLVTRCCGIYRHWN